MLVLSRKLDEVIRIGNDVEITVLAVKGNTVRLGIKAPRSVKVLRAELPVNDVQTTVAAIVDSPAPAEQQLFVGKVQTTAQGSEVTLHAETVSDAEHQAAIRLARGTASPRIGSLRAYLRDHHNSTAV